MLLALELVSAMHKRVSASVDSRECNVSLRFPSCWRASKPNNGSSSKADMQGQSKRGETEAANSELRYGYMEEGEESERVSGTCFLV